MRGPGARGGRARGGGGGGGPVVGGGGGPGGGGGGGVLGWGAWAWLGGRGSVSRSSMSRGPVSRVGESGSGWVERQCSAPTGRARSSSAVSPTSTSRVNARAEIGRASCREVV